MKISFDDILKGGHEMEERKIFYIILNISKNPRVIDVSKSSKYANGKRSSHRGEEFTL